MIKKVYPEWGATADDHGKIHLDDRALFDTYVRANFKGKRLKVSVKLAYKHHTIKQRGYYRGVVLPVISEATGHSENELHEIFKKKHLSPEFHTVEFFGETYTIWSDPTTTDKDTAEFGRYIDRIIADMAEYGIDIPEPYTAS